MILWDFSPFVKIQCLEHNQLEYGQQLVNPLLQLPLSSMQSAFGVSTHATFQEVFRFDLKQMRTATGYILHSGKGQVILTLVLSPWLKMWSHLGNVRYLEQTDLSWWLMTWGVHCCVCSFVHHFWSLNGASNWRLTTKLPNHLQWPTRFHSVHLFARHGLLWSIHLQRVRWSSKCRGPLAILTK